jgi:hypothetical protein
MKKAEAESAIRHLCHVFAKERGLSMQPDAEPSFGEFLNWVRDNYPSYLNFRSVESVHSAVEWWWADEFQQKWRY